MTSVTFWVLMRWVRELRERAGRSDRSDGRCSGKGSGFFSLESIQGNRVAVVGLELGPVPTVTDFLNVRLDLGLEGIEVDGGMDVEVDRVIDLEEHLDVGGQQGSDGPLDGEEGVAGLGLDGEVDDLVEVLGASPHEGAGLAGEGEGEVAVGVDASEEVLLPGMEAGAGVGSGLGYLLEEGQGHELSGHLVH